jgi:Zn-dependent protease
VPPQTIQIALGIAFLILSLGVHEAAHAYVADRCGDGTAREEGRLTLNPMAHIDPFMTIILPLILFMTSGFIFGGARPVPVNPMRLRHPLRDMSLVALAGPASNLVLALLFSIAWKSMVYWGGMPTSALAPRVMEMALTFNIILAIFNMIPIPPLDGSRVMAYLLPNHMRESYVSLERFGLMIVLLLVMTGSLRMILGATLWPMVGLVDTLTGGAW